MADSRISGRIGQTINLNVMFFRNGVPAYPYAVRRVDIYKKSVRDENLVLQVLIPSPDDPDYPAPILVADADSDGVIEDGEFVLPLDIPSDFEPGVYFDVWNFLPNELGTGGDIDDEDLWAKCCNKFWIYTDGFACWDGLETIKFGFEPMNMEFNRPSSTHLEVGMMPLPLYDFDADLVMPALARISATITVETVNCELLIDAEPMTVGLRSGSYRANPFVLRWQLDTTRFIKGTYKYRVHATLPNGTIHVSPYMPLVIQ